MRLVPFVLLTACATAPRPALEPEPEYAPVYTEAAPPRGLLYASCVAAAIAAPDVTASYVDDVSLLVFTCHGEPAAEFFNALQEWSAQEKSEWHDSDRTYRSTARVRTNLVGVDYCHVRTIGGDDATCIITLNTGRFLRGQVAPAPL